MTSNWSKTLKVRILKSSPSFDMSHDMGYKKVIVVVIEVIRGHIFGHRKFKWSPNDLKCWQVNYWMHYLLLDMSLDVSYETLTICVHGGHLRSHFRLWRGQLTSNWSNTLKVQIVESLSFIDMSWLEKLWIMWWFEWQ